MHYYKFNIADYRKDTTHLTMLEHGIYRTLIDWYYLDENQIPLDIDLVARKLRLTTEDELKSLKMVLFDFFEKTEKGHKHRRINVDILSYHELATKNAANGKLGGRPVKTQTVMDGNPNESDPKGNHKPLTINHKPIDTNICPPDGELDALPDCDHKAVIAIYHQCLPTLRKVEVWNGTRAGYLRQRWREVAIELSAEKEITSKDVLKWWTEFFVHIGKSRFLTGRTNDKGGRTFAADLEWIIKPSNFAKIIEGKYHGS